MIIYLLFILIYLAAVFIFASEKKKRKFYLKVLVFGSILGPVFDVANYFFSYYSYSNFKFILLGLAPPEILLLYGPCCVITLYLAQTISRV